MKCLSVCFLSLGLIAPALQADWREDAGYPQLQSELGPALPTGQEIPLMMSEARFGGAYLPQATSAALPYAGTGELSGKLLIPHSGPGAASAHAASVAAFLGGSSQSLVPGSPELHLWLADDFIVQLFSQPQPPSFAGAVQNHSWVGTLNSEALDIELLRRLDVLIDRDGPVVSTPLNNGSVMAPLQANAYHSISAGLLFHPHPTTHSNLDGMGRMKPDLVVNETVTSLAGPAVASAAALLLDAIRPQHPEADDPRVVKAMLLSGASKQRLLGWRRQNPARPYDEVHGAGELNVLHAHHILSAGRQAASDTDLRSLRGWDRATSRTEQPRRYFLRLPPGQWGRTVSISLTWHRQISADFSTSILADLNLRLAHASGFVVGSAVDQSVSTVDNVEHLFLRQLPPGDYAIEVPSAAAEVVYGLAWEVETGPGPQLHLQRSGQMNVLSLSELDPLKTYTIEVSSDLVDWQPATTLRTLETTPSTNAVWQESTAWGARFYRLAWEP